ncbi:MAG: OmpA family protein [Ignavibacteriales bacterium]|nr:OmpA family protein [Ignavibacteriales bacterium]
MKKNIYIFGAAILIMVTLFSAQVFGQFKDRGVRFGIAAGSMQGLTKMTDNALDPTGKLYLRHNISGDFDGELSGMYGGIKGQYYQTDMWGVEYQALYSPYSFYDDQLHPYLGAGLGITYYFANVTLRNPNVEKNGYAGYVPITLGAEYAVNDWLQFDVNTNFNYAFTNTIVSTWVPNSKIGSGNDAWWGLFAGVSCTIFGPDNKAAEKEASRIRNEELAAAEARRVQEANAAEAKRVKEANAAEAKRVQEAAAAEARRVREAAEAQRIQDSIKTAAEAQRLKDMAKAAPRPVQVVVQKETDTVFVLIKGKTVVLKGVNFEFNKATLTQYSETILWRAYRAMIANPDARVVITGHTDNVGSDKFNQTLSLKRAQAVKNWLVKKGIASNRMRTVGKGEKEPVADNKTEEGRAQNRRMEFYVQ